LTPSSQIRLVSLIQPLPSVEGIFFVHFHSQDGVRAGAKRLGRRERPEKSPSEKPHELPGYLCVILSFELDRNQTIFTGARDTYLQQSLTS